MDLQDVFERVDLYVKTIIEEINIPGMAIAVTDREKLLGTFTYGFTDISARTPVTSGSLFAIASIGKSFTAIILLQLRDEGKLDLHTPVAKYLPWFQVRSKYPPITLHHLLGHTSGIIRGTEMAPYGLFDSWALREMEVHVPPGEYWHYSSIGYKTLGFLLENVTGKTFKELIQTRVLDPLGMTATHPVVTFETRKKAAVGYCSIYDDRPENPNHTLVPALWNECATGDGCQASTAEDMAIFLRMLLNRGIGPHSRLISEESFYLMAPLAKRMDIEQYGYALVAYPAENRTYLGHGGGNAGYSSHMLADVDEGLGVVILTNRRTECEAVYRLAEYILKALQAEKNGLEISPPQSISVLDSSANIADYTGIYKSNDEILNFIAKNDKLLLEYNGRTVPLEKRDGDTFYANNPDLDLFLFEFKREGEKVTEVFYGARWFTNERYAGPTNFNYPQKWAAYTGHYRTRNPELSNFRIVIRKDTLVLIYPGGNVELLNPLENGLFRIGEDPRSPETLCFDTIVESKALRAIYSGCPYYRTFTG